MENFPKTNSEIAVVLEVLGERSEIPARSAPVLLGTDGPHARCVRAAGGQENGARRGTQR